MSLAIEKRVRRQGRTLAAQALYQAEITGGDPELAIDMVRRLLADEEGEAPDDAAEAWARVLVAGVLSRRMEIDQLIEGASANWRLDRMARMDLQILRIGVAELLLSRRDVPIAVAIDEAIEVARVLGSEHAARFVNGILDAIAKHLTGHSGSPAEGAE